MKRLLFALMMILSAVVTLWGVRVINTDHRNSWDLWLASQYDEINASGNRTGREKAADHPGLAALQYYYMTIDPAAKRVPVERLREAFAYKRQMVHTQIRGSAPVFPGWSETGSNMGGRTRAIMWDPGDAAGKKVWAGGVTGGLWYIDDITGQQSSWVAVNDFWDNLAVSCITSDPNDPQTFYVGTGEAQTALVIYRESSGVGCGIWKSSDGGQTWDLIPSTADFRYVTDIKVRDESGVSAVYAAVVSGVYHGINQQSLPTDGLYRSVDGGQTWDQVLPDIPGEEVPYAPADLEISAAGRIFAGTQKNLNGDGGSTILWSDDGTPGSWSVYDDYVAIIQNDPEYNIPGRVILACAPSDEDIAYAVLGAGYISSSNGFNYSRGCYILRTDDHGGTWTQKNLPGGDPEWATLAWHALVAAVDPNNPDMVYAGGLDVWKSSNGGNSWSHLSDWSLMYSGGGPDYVHADQHVQLYKPGSSDEMLFGSDGGVFYTSSAASSSPVFQEKNRNFSTLQFYTCDIYPLAGQNYFVGGLQDNGTLLYMGSPLDINDMIDGGDGAYCFIDRNDPQIMITSVYYNRYSIFLNWSYYNYISDYSSGVFINPADYDSEMNTLYANAVSFGGSYSNRLLRISGFPYDISGTFINLNTGLNTYFSSVTASPYAPAGTSTVYAGSQNGRLFRVDHAEGTPQVTEIGSPDFPVAYLSSLSIGGSEDTLVVTFSNFGVPPVWVTFDGGQSWEDKSGNLPDMPIRWALCHPSDARAVMLATELGVWMTDDISAPLAEWVPDNNFPNVRVDMLRIREADNTVLVATHGRGLFWGEWNLSPATGTAQLALLQPVIFPNPSPDGFRMTLPATASGNAVITLVSRDGRQVMNQAAFIETGNDGIWIDARSFDRGVYLIVVDCNGIRYTAKAILN
ncbi:MAG: T9SS type A sorting domain-containing protein [Bacteroidales bacterium]|nr:T9SS type A sorting domain-containing protein [Bacteroidales bacterium]